MNRIAFVCLLGVGTVFVGLVCIVILCSLVSFICRKFLSTKSEGISATQVAPKAAPKTSGPIADRKKLLAAVCAVIAEENGCEVNAIRVLSFKKI